MRDTFDRATGRWREILPAFGMPSSVLNGRNQPCPLCGGTDRFRFCYRLGRRRDRGPWAAISPSTTAYAARSGDRVLVNSSAMWVHRHVTIGRP